MKLKGLFKDFHTFFPHAQMAPLCLYTLGLQSDDLTSSLGYDQIFCHKLSKTSQERRVE